MIEYLQLSSARSNEFTNRYEFLSSEETVAATDLVVVTERGLAQRTRRIEVMGPHALRPVL